MTLVPLSDDEVKALELSDVVALYVDQKSGVINVGRPYLAPYYPALANMFGFSASLERGYYLVIKESIDLADKMVYSVVVTSEQTIGEVSIINSVDTDPDLLANYCNNKMRK